RRWREAGAETVWRDRAGTPWLRAPDCRRDLLRNLVAHGLRRHLDRVADRLLRRASVRLHEDVLEAENRRATVGGIVGESTQSPGAVRQQSHAGSPAPAPFRRGNARLGDGF